MQENAADRRTRPTPVRVNLAPRGNSAKSGAACWFRRTWELPVHRVRISAATAAAVVALLAAGVGLSGCIVAAAGGGAVTGYAIIAEDLSPEQQMRDIGIKAEVQSSWGVFDQDMAHRLDATVFDGEVLITGRVPNRHWREEAVRRARSVAGVRRVDDRMEVGPDTHFIDDARDTWITTQLRGELVGDVDIKSINYTIKTTDGIVYIMGFARTQPELDKVVEHARTIAGVRRVTPFIRVLAAADLNGPPPGEDRDVNGPGPGEDDTMPPDRDEDEDQDRGGPPDNAAPRRPAPDRGTIKAEPLGPQQ